MRGFATFGVRDLFRGRGVDVMGREDDAVVVVGRGDVDKRAIGREGLVPGLRGHGGRVDPFPFGRRGII